MKTLDEIFCEHGTDKGSKHATYGHNYSSHYERFFEPLRLNPLKLLEIGVGGAESIKSWLEYFPLASIYGIDIVGKTNDWNDPTTTPDPRYRFQQGDQSDPTMFKCAMANFGVNNFDILVDDGSHVNTDIIPAFNCMWDYIVPGGLYCIEDLGAGYTPGSVHVKPAYPPHAQWLHAFVDVLMTSPGGIDSVYFANELAIIRKKA